MQMELKHRLESIHARYHHAERLQHDPVGVVHRYTLQADQEIAAWISSGLAFGRVNAFLPVVDTLLGFADRCGGPLQWIRDGGVDRDRRAIASLQYRWIQGTDILDWLHIVQRVYDQHDTLAERFQLEKDERDIGPALTRLVAEMRSFAPRDVANMSRGLRFLLPSPVTGSACKRWCMFLRWMIRHADGIDLGLWTHVPPSALVMPVDTHVFRIARTLGLTARRQADWKAALEITERMRLLFPEDPVRYDFALAHVGISGDGLQHP